LVVRLAVVDYFSLLPYTLGHVRRGPKGPKRSAGVDRSPYKPLLCGYTYMKRPNVVARENFTGVAGLFEEEKHTVKHTVKVIWHLEVFDR
jgi:hypothetical protein